MNRRERRYGRMYLLPLLLGLTGIALLVLEWVLQLHGSGASGPLDAALRAGSFRDVFLHSGLLKSLDAVVRPNLVILIFPLLLLALYLIRIPPKVSRIVIGAALLVALFHVAVVLYCGKHDPTPLCLKVPGYGLLAHLRSAQVDKRFIKILPASADGAFVLSSVSTVFTCLAYTLAKAHSERRNAAFDARNAYLIGTAAAPAEPELPEPEPEAHEVPDVSDEPTRVLELPEDFYSQR